MRKYAFNYLLIGLSMFDLLFVLCAVPVHTIPSLNLAFLNRLTEYRLFGILYQYFFYPMTTVAYSGSVYTTVAITIERYKREN